MTREYITLAHYPVYTSNEIDLMDLHTSSYGLCSECSTYSKYVAYPCAVIQAIENPVH
jgi:hypothetical protein